MLKMLKMEIRRGESLASTHAGRVHLEIQREGRAVRPPESVFCRLVELQVCRSLSPLAFVLLVAAVPN